MRTIPARTRARTDKVKPLPALCAREAHTLQKQRYRATLHPGNRRGLILINRLINIDPVTTTHPEKRPGRPSAQDTTDVRRKLLDATRAACISKGLDRVSSKAIAAEAGVNPAMINYYFGNREALHEAMMLDALSPLLAQISLAEENTHQLNFRQFLRAYMETLAANPWLPRLVVREVLPENGRLRELFLTQLAQRAASLFPELMRNELPADNDRPEFDPALLAMSLMSLAVFPFVAAPILEPALGLDLENQEAVQRLIAHTLGVVDRVLASGARP